MPKQVKIRRGTTTAHATFTGAEGEVTYDTDLKVLRLHDGVTPGGKVLYDALFLNKPGTLNQTLAAGALSISGQDGDGYGLYVTKNTQLAGTVCNILGRVNLNGAFAKNVGSLTYAATTNLDFAGSPIKTITLTGNVTFTTSNLIGGVEASIIITCDGTGRNFTFPSWVWVGGTAPASIAANKRARLDLLSVGTVDTQVIARYSVES